MQAAKDDQSRVRLDSPFSSRSQPVLLCWSLSLFLHMRPHIPTVCSLQLTGTHAHTTQLTTPLLGVTLYSPSLPLLNFFGVAVAFRRWLILVIAMPGLSAYFQALAIPQHMGTTSEARVMEGEGLLAFHHPCLAHVSTRTCRPALSLPGHSWARACAGGEGLATITGKLGFDCSAAMPLLLTNNL